MMATENVRFSFFASLTKAPSCSVATKTMPASSKPSRSRSRFSAGIRSSRCDKCRFSCFERDRLCGKDGLEGLTGSSPVMDEESCPAMQIFGGFRIKQAAQGKIYPIPDCRILSSAKASEQSLVFVWRGSDSGKIILFPIWDLATCQCRTYVNRRSFKRVLHKMLSGDDHKLRVGFDNFVIHRRLPGEDLWCTRIFEEADGPDSQPILRVKSS